MFTGIIEEIGHLEAIERGSQSAVLHIGCEKVLEGTQAGDSIAVNGVCLTVTSLGKKGYTADVMAETLDRSSLGDLKRGSRVNLERAMAADGRFGAILWPVILTAPVSYSLLPGMRRLSGIKSRPEQIYYGM